MACEETVSEVCAEITDATMRVGAFFTPTIYEWRDRILDAHEREMRSVRQCLTGDCERFKLGAEPCPTCTVYAYEREIAAKDDMARIASQSAQARFDEEIAAKDAEIARLKAALKPVMECATKSAEGSMPNYMGCWEAVRETQRIMKEGVNNG